MSSRSGWPRRSSRPATGSTAIGSISARPSCCRAPRGSASCCGSPRAGCAAASAGAQRQREGRRAQLAAAPAGLERSATQSRLTAGSTPGAAESSVTPSPIRIGTAARSEPSPPQTADPAGRVARLRRRGDQAQHGGMQGVELAGQLRVAAVHGQRVLGQVVGADGEEVGLRGELVGERWPRRASRSSRPAPARPIAERVAALVEHARARRAARKRRSPSAA